MQEALFPHFGEIEHVEEVHPAQGEHDDTQLRRDVLNAFDYIGRLLSDPEEKQDETDIDQIESNNQEVVYGIGHLLISRERINEEDSAVLVEGVSNPDGHREADEKVRDVDSETRVHDSCISIVRGILTPECFNR